jgi:hypothetical protein
MVFSSERLEKEGFPMITRSSVVSKANDGVGPYFNIKRITGILSLISHVRKYVGHRVMIEHKKLNGQIEGVVHRGWWNIFLTICRQHVSLYACTRTRRKRTTS